MTKKKQIIIIGTIGILILIISGFLECFLHGENDNWLMEFVYEATFSIAFVLVGVFLGNIVWDLLGGDPIEKYQQSLMETNTLLADGIKTGLIGVVSSSSDMGSSKEWLDIIKETKKELCIQGYTLLVWTRSNKFEETLLDLAKRGVKIRLIFMHEDAVYIKAGVNEKQIPGLTLENVKQEIRAMTTYMENVIKKFEENKKSWELGKIEFRKIKKSLITCQIVKTDEKQYVTPYLASANTSHCPLFIVKNADAPLYEKYTNEFESMWKYDDLTDSTH